MAVTIKSEREIELMRESCRLLAIVHKELGEMVRPGITTKDIDVAGEALIRKLGCIPNFKNYNGYPASICVSVNDEVVHGIPTERRILQEGDIVSLTRESFFAGIKFAKAGNRLYEISNAIDAYIKPYGYGIVRDMVGHGIGTKLHEDPQIPNFAQKRRGIKLEAGMTLAIEPMINMGGWEVEWLDDDWTIVTADGSLSAHYENTVLITDGEPEILTLCD